MADALHIVPGADERDAGRTMDEANAAFMEGVKEVRVLAIEMERRFEQIEDARRVLDGEGVSVRVSFDSPTMAAYGRWREQHPQTEPAVLPRSLR